MSTADKDLNEGTLTCFTFFKEEKRKKGTKKRILRKNLFIFIFCFCVYGNWERFKCREGLWPQFFLKVFLLFTCKLLCPPFPYYSPPQYPHHHSLPRFSWLADAHKAREKYLLHKKEIRPPFWGLASSSSSSSSALDAMFTLRWCVKWKIEKMPTWISHCTSGIIREWTTTTACANRVGKQQERERERDEVSRSTGSDRPEEEDNTNNTTPSPSLASPSLTEREKKK